MNEELNLNKRITGDIVTAILTGGSFSLDSVGDLINLTFEAVSGLGIEKKVDIPAAPEPAVTIRASVKHDHVTCLECGYKAKMLKRHISATHGQTVDEYRAKWGLARDHALTAPAYSEKRRDLAVSLGLGRIPKVRRKGKIRRAA